MTLDLIRNMCHVAICSLYVANLMKRAAELNYHLSIVALSFKVLSE